MTIRPAEPPDTPAIARVFCRARARMAYLPPPPPDDVMERIFDERILPRSEAWVVEADGCVVGYAALDGDMLEAIYVEPGAQGRGLGTALLERAKQLRPDGLRLWVFQKNEAARRLYERHGFRLVELTDGAGNMEREPDALYEWTPEAG